MVWEPDENEIAFRNIAFILSWDDTWNYKQKEIN